MTEIQLLNLSHCNQWSYSIICIITIFEDIRLDHGNITSHHLNSTCKYFPFIPLGSLSNGLQLPYLSNVSVIRNTSCCFRFSSNSEKMLFFILNIKSVPQITFMSYQSFSNPSHCGNHLLFLFWNITFWLGSKGLLL